MTDIARLGFDIDTGPLASANTELSKLVTGAQKAERAVDSLAQKSAGAFQTVNHGIANAARGAQNAAATVMQAANQNVTATQAITSAATGAASATAAAAQQAARASTAASAAARTAANDNLALQQSVEGVTSAYKILSALIVGGAIGKAIDQWIQLGNALDLARVKGEDQAATIGKLFDISNRNNVSIETTTTLYRRAAIAAAAIGASQDDLLKITQASSAALKIQGTSAEAARGALLQLGQSLGTGRLRMQEFNSITENLQPIAQAAAKAILGPTAGVSQLKAAMEAGGITSKQWAQAIISATNDLQRTADSMQTTVSGALTTVWNGFVRLTGAINEATGASKFLTDSFVAIGLAMTDAGKWIDANKDKIPELVANLTAVATVVTTLLIPAFVELGVAGVTAITSITVAMARNPFGLLAIAITTVLSALYVLRDEISDVLGGDVMGVVKDAANFVVRAFLSAYEELKFVWSSFGDIIGQAFRGAVNTIVDGINFLLKVSTDAINDLINLVNSGLNGMNSLLDKIPGARARFGTLSPLSATQLDGMTNPDQDARLGAARDATDQRQAIIATTDYVGKLANAFQSATKATKDFDAAQETALDAVKKGKKDPWQSLIQRAVDYVSKLQAQTAALDMDYEAGQRQLHVTELTSKALEARIVLTDTVKNKINELADAMAKADIVYQSAKFVNDYVKNANEQVAASQAEAEALGMSTVAGQAYIEVQKAIYNERKKGIELTPTQIASIQSAALAVAQVRQETKNYSDALAFVHDASTGFFKQLTDDLLKGKDLWTSFGDAAQQALSKILSKLEDLAINSVFDMLTKGVSFGDTGLGGLIGGLTRVFGGASGNSSSPNATGTFGTGGFGSLFSSIGSSLSDMFTTTGDWFNNLFSSSNSYSNINSLLANTGGIGGSGISGLGALGALAGGASGIFQLMNAKTTGQTLGGIGSLVGAGVSLIPGIGQIAGPAIAILSNLLPGLFGSTPPTVSSYGTGTLSYGPGGYGTSGATYGANAGQMNTTNSLSAVGSNISNIFSLFKNGVVDPSHVWGLGLNSFSQQYPNGSSFSNMTSFLRDPNGGSRQWGQGSTAEDVGLQAAGVQAAVNSILEGAVGPISDAMRTALGNVNNSGRATFDQLASAVNFVQDTYDKLGKTTTQAETALGKIDDQFKAISDSAAALGLSLDPVNAAAKQAKEDYAKSVMHDINNFLDPVTTQLNDLADAAKVSRAEIQYLIDQGLLSLSDMDKVNEYYLKKEESLKEQLYGTSLDALQNAINQLMYGAQSNATDATAYAAQYAKFQTDAQKALSGDTTATSNIVNEGIALAQAGQKQYGSSKQYEDLKAYIESVFQGVQALIGAPTRSVTNSSDGTVTQGNGATVFYQQQVQQLQTIVSSQSQQIQTLTAKITQLMDLLQRTATNK